MPQLSAGLLLYRHTANGPEVLLVHPGGPFWARKDAGAWSMPKGQIDADEDHRAAALREFAEETGCVPPVDLVLLGDFRQASGKIVTAFAAEGDFDLAGFSSNNFTMEWPPRSGTMAEFPEADRADWFDLATAAEKITSGQRPILDALAELLAK